jgi:two-component sensor histidine kinase
MNPQIISIIGLITNEFITNAFKYGYSTSEINTFGMDSKIDKKAGLEINLHTSGKFWDPNKVNSGKGLLIIKSLAAEIDANIVIEYNHHTTLKLTLKNQSNKLKVWKK